MNTLNLIYPDKSAIKFSTMAFPDGQPHIKIDITTIQKADLDMPLRILSRIDNTNDLIMVLFTKNTLDYLGFEHVELHVSYLMAARMDRIMLEGEPFSLKVVAAILNQANFKKIKIFDPHSEVACALIERCYPVSNHQFVKEALADYLMVNATESFCLVSPDAGALKKIHKLAQYLKIDNVVECMKERDVRTGSLTNFKTTTADLEGQTCFIVDDICDGGGTFVGTAKMLKEKHAKKIVLIVSHGIFSRGTPLDGVDKIYTTDSFKTVENVNCFSIDRYL